MLTEKELTQVLRHRVALGESDFPVPRDTAYYAPNYMPTQTERKRPVARFREVQDPVTGETLYQSMGVEES